MTTCGRRGSMDHQKRKHPRLKTFNYASGGMFCITICTQGKQKILGEIVDSELAYVRLSPLGHIVQELIQRIPTAYHGVIVHSSVVMPNHAHILLQISEIEPVSLFTVIRSLKTFTSKQWGKPVWQRSYFEHVVRDEQDAMRCWKYIEENPKKWTLDPYFE